MQLFTLGVYISYLRFQITRGKNLNSIFSEYIVYRYNEKIIRYERV